MGDPVLGIKCFCACAVITLVLCIIQWFMVALRVFDHRFTILGLERALIILKLAFAVLTHIALLWSAIAWLASW